MKTSKRSTQHRRGNRKPRPAAGAPKRLDPRSSAGLRSAPDDPPFLKFWKRANDTLPETIGKADLGTLNSALGFLFSRLREARAQFEQERDNGRRGAFTALAAFHMFITLFRRPHEEALHVPIVRLQDALVSLEQNRIESILKPVQRRGRAPSSQSYDGLRGHAAATVQLLLQEGLAHDDAHRAVATQLRQLRVRPERGSGTVTATTVANWCDKVSSDVGRHGMAAMMYDYKLARGQEILAALPNDQSRQSAALQELAYWVGTIFPELQKPT